ncbi:UNVERIFIED_CONTAM: Nudix hydrolase 15, mitochondrial [Sesamum calycinum]|uniref:Nudix hydrolase 15, mitochondrial n=1 Tax=Sesamum calycinum TaxID=2727403 RepID=A0AAW2ME52_9LAMI
MNSYSFGRSETLVKFAQRLRLADQHNNFDVLDDSSKVKDSRIQDSDAELIPLVGLKPSRAAVLICLFEDERGHLRVILTKRSSAMSSHSGEVALPGGKWEESDANDVDTALREAQEEIGLDPSIVEVVTVLDPFHTKRNITVAPVIGIIWDKRAFNPVPNAAEVESIFDAPLEIFSSKIYSCVQDENRRQEEREWMGYKYLLHFFDHQDENKSYVIWALTAGILIKAASVVYQQPLLLKSVGLHSGTEVAIEDMYTLLLPSV